MHRLRIAIVGLNFGASVVDSLLTAPLREQLEVVTVCDRDPSRAQEVASRTGIRPSFDLEEVLNDPAVEAIGLFSSPVGRADLIRRIVRRGKHVMTTKPFELDPDKAMSVLLEARQLGRIVHLNSPSPLPASDLAQVSAWQQKFHLGRPVSCLRSVTANYRERADGSWYDDPDQCPVAPIFRLGIYCINDMVQLLGPAEKVTVLQSRMFTGRPTPDNAQVSILFKSGAIGSVFASFCVGDGQFYANSMTLHCENGTVYRNVEPAPWGRLAKRSKMMVVARDGPEHCVTEEAEFDDHSGEYQWDEFVRSVRGEPLGIQVTAEEIVAGIRVIAAMREAEKTGTAVAV